MMRIMAIRVVLPVLVMAGVPAAGGFAQGPLPPERIGQLARLLPDAPRGVGRAVGDRESWDDMARRAEFRDVIRDAQRLLKEPIPELPDDLYLDFSRTGNRTRYQRVVRRRHSRVTRLALAETLENRGRCLAALEKAILAACDERTWVLPAHDRSLRNYRGEVREIDLQVAGFSWELATLHYWLGTRLSPAVRERIRAELERRTFRPFESMVTEGKPRMWWLKTTNNWNAVCLAGVTGSALAVIPSAERRAFFVAAAEKYIQNFLNGFTPDGYCSEGIGYWNYGFGHFVLLAETIHQATRGAVDWLRDRRVETIARFGPRMEILPGVYPAFADCHLGTEPNERLVAYLSRRYGWGFEDVERRGLLLAPGPSTSLVQLGVFGFPNSATARPPGEAAPSKPLREWFPEAGILICRPGTGQAAALGAALKGGHNAEHHNHNDVGSYVVALDSATPLVDPGSEVYTARTFSSRRYESNVLNSFGHPVPRVAGQLQRSGRSAAAEVIHTQFTDRTDTLVLDLRNAYHVEGLEKLQRTFVFSRDGRGSLSVTDEVIFDKPLPFGTALITFEPWRQLAPGRLRIGQGRGAVEVSIDAGGQGYEIHPEKIEEDLGRPGVPTRLGIELEGPVHQARITVTIRPVS